MQVHDLSELLFKVQNDKLDAEFTRQMLDEAEQDGYRVEDYEGDEGAGQDSEGVAAAGGFSTQSFQNSFTITEVKQKPFVKKRGGRKRR